jgi:hypothetical protein
LVLLWMVRSSGMIVAVGMQQCLPAVHCFCAGDLLGHGDQVGIAAPVGHLMLNGLFDVVDCSAG